MAWVWVVLYLVVGIVISRWFTSRSSPISRTDAFALVVIWPGFFAFLALRVGINALGGLAGGRD
jgi:hypothetical protein